MAREFVKTPLEVPLGTTWEEAFRFLDADGVALDVSAYTPRMHVRDPRDRETLLLELTSSNGRILMTDAATGIVRIKVAAADVESMSPNNQRKEVKYDLELRNTSLSPTYIIPTVDGSIVLTPRITYPV